MPTITHYRLWCKTCKDWTLHWHPISGEDNCQICNTDYTDVFLSEIPEKKITEQRERYKLYKAQKTQDKYSSYITSAMGMAKSGLFASWPKPEIVECPAGQDIIDKKAKEDWEKEYQRQKELRQKLQEEFDTTFKVLHRNDACACGSGKKYKNCCLTKYRNL